MIEIPVDLGDRRYPIVIGHGALRALPRILAPFAKKKLMLVSDRRVFSLHGGAVEALLDGVGTVHRVLMPAGERYKTRRTLDSLHDAFLDAGLGRDALVIALGGGVVGDVAGYAAATYMRGIPWVGVPTTLLAMVDSSIGGKVGINHPRGKNLIGAFHQPRAVVVDPAFLDTLPPRERQGGAYEILKCGVIGDRALFRSMAEAPARLVGWDRVGLENAIAAACRLKAEVVESDEREGDRRRVLNLGHTLGHALEAVTRYRRFTHGEAVGWGMIGATWIADRRGLLPRGTYDAVTNAVDRLGPRPAMADLSHDKILAALQHDKKAQDGRVPFVLPTAVGRVVVQPGIRRSEIVGALKAMAARERAKRG